MQETMLPEQPFYILQTTVAVAEPAGRLRHSLNQLLNPGKKPSC
jgi:hypothetical protein